MIAYLCNVDMQQRSGLTRVNPPRPMHGEGRGGELKVRREGWVAKGEELVVRGEELVVKHEGMG